MKNKTKNDDVDSYVQTHNIKIPTGDYYTIDSFTYFIPIDICNIQELDRKFEMINGNCRMVKGYFNRIYTSIANDYTSFKIYPASWKNVISMPFYNEDEWFERLTIHIYRGSQKYVVLMISLCTSDLMKYQTWLFLRRAFSYKEEKHKGFTRCYEDYETQKMEYESYFKNIEARGLKLINDYFQDISFDAEEYHAPCVRTNRYRRCIPYPQGETAFFWESIGLEDFGCTVYVDDSETFSICQNMKDNYINLFVNEENIDYDKAYGSISNQIFSMVSHSMFKSIGPGLALSEIQNLIYQKYQLMLNKKGIIKETKKLALMGEIIRYIEIFDTDILEKDFFYRDGISFNKRKLNKNRIIEDDYYDLIKRVVLEKKRILSKLYLDETNYLNRKLNIQMSKNNYLLQYLLALLALLSTIIGIITIVK